MMVPFVPVLKMAFSPAAHVSGVVMPARGHTLPAGHAAQADAPLGR